MAPTIGQPACQEQLIEAAKLVAKSVEGIVSAAQSACNEDNLLQDLGSAATAVTRALNDLLQHIKKAAGPTKVRLVFFSLWSFVDVGFFLPVSVCLCVCQSVGQSACLPACLPASLLVSLPASLSVSLSLCLPLCLSLCLPLCLSVSVSLCVSLSQVVCDRHLWWGWGSPFSI